MVRLTLVEIGGTQQLSGTNKPSSTIHQKYIMQAFAPSRPTSLEIAD